VSRGKPECINGLNERNGGQYPLIDREGYVWVQYSVKWIKMVPGMRPAPPRNMNANPTENERIAMRPLYLMKKFSERSIHLPSTSAVKTIMKKVTGPW
jgi:hypothetical protein